MLGLGTRERTTRAPRSWRGSCRSRAPSDCSNMLSASITSTRSSPTNRARQPERLGDPARLGPGRRTRAARSPYSWPLAERSRKSPTCAPPVTSISSVSPASTSACDGVGNHRPVVRSGSRCLFVIRVSGSSRVRCRPRRMTPFRGTARGCYGFASVKTRPSAAAAPPAPRAATARRARAAPRGAGSHQFQRPSTAIRLGTRSARTIVASMRIATARPSPNCCSPTIRPATKPENAATMITAAAVTIRPVRSSPCATARVVVVHVVPRLAHPRDEEDLVVHREAEQHREQEDRDPALDLVELVEAERGRGRRPSGRRRRASRTLAATESRLSSTAFSGSSSERNARSSSRYVSTSTASTSHGKNAVGAVEEVDALRRPAAREHAHVRRGSARRRDQRRPGAGATKRCAGGEPYSCRPASHDLPVAAARVDERRPARCARARPRDPRAGRRRAARSRRVHRGGRRAAGPAAVDHDLRRRERAGPDRPLEQVEALHGLRVPRDALRRAGRQLEREDRDRGGDEERDADGEVPRRARMIERASRAQRPCRRPRCRQARERQVQRRRSASATGRRSPRRP